MPRANARIVLETCPSAEAAAAACAALIVAGLQDALQGRPRVGFMVSGGRSPRAVLTQVVAADLDWARVDICASDERLVLPNHPDSTEGMVRAVFHRAAKPLNYRGIGLDLDSQAALAHWRTGVATLPWPAAVAFLGIGEDGHTASLFSGCAEAADPALWAAAVPQTAPHAHPRLTLGRKALLAVDLITLIAAGPAKTAALRRALAPGADPASMPAALLQQAGRAVIFTA